MFSVFLKKFHIYFHTGSHVYVRTSPWGGSGAPIQGPLGRMGVLEPSHFSLACLGGPSWPGLSACWPACRPACACLWPACLAGCAGPSAVGCPRGGSDVAMG